MDSEIANEILEELASTLQPIETQNAALLEFIKEKGIAKEDDLAPYLERAAAASAVRWRATRVRMARLFSSAEKKAEQAADREKAARPQKEQPPPKPAQGDPRSQDGHSTKEAESPSSGQTAQAESDRANQDDEHGVRSAQKDSTRPQPSRETRDKSAGTDESSAR